MKLDKTVIHIDPLILFTRATLLVERQNEEEQINNFKFEFTPEPSALFQKWLHEKNTEVTIVQQSTKASSSR